MLETVREHSRPSRKEDFHLNVPRGAFAFEDRGDREDRCQWTRRSTSEGNRSSC